MMFATTRNVVKAIASTASGILSSHSGRARPKIARVYPLTASYGRPVLPAVSPVGARPGKGPPRQRRLNLGTRSQEEVAPEVAEPARRFTVAARHGQALVAAVRPQRAVAAVREPLQRRRRARPHVEARAVRLDATFVLDQEELPVGGPG